MKRTPRLISLLAALAAVPAGAVNLSTDGTGQVLLYPYYTTRNGFVSTLSVANNNTFHTKAVKMNIFEGKNSAQVFGLHIWLSPRDVWTASIVDNGTGAAIYTEDNSCTAPALARSAATANPLVNFYYTGQVTGTYNDNGGNGLDRTREGYIEIIEMGVAANGADAASSPATVLGTTLATATKHTAAGTPAGCGTVAVNTAFANPDILTPAGGLSGSYIIIGATTGTEFAGTPVALQKFFVPSTAGANLYTVPGGLLPDLSSVSPARSDVFIGDAGGPAVVTVPDWVAIGGQTVDAVSAVLMRSVIANEFDVSTGFKTDFVITAPTKRFYVAAGSAAAATGAPQPAIAPFASTFASASVGGAQACDPTFSEIYDREEGSSPGGATNLCWGSTVVSVVPQGGTLAAAALFGSANSVALTAPASGSSTSFHNGWAGLWPTRGSNPSNSGSGQLASGGGAAGVTIASDAAGGLRNLVAVGNRYRGLPVIGFAAIQGLIGGQGYGGIFNLKSTVNILP